MSPDLNNQDQTDQDQRQTSETEEPRSVRETLESAVTEAAGGAAADISAEVVEPLAAPKHWPKEDQEFFTSQASNRKTQEWLLDRDKRYANGYQKVSGEFKQLQDRWKPFDEVLAPHREFLQKSGLSEAAVLKNYIAVDTMLATQPEDALRYIIETYKITPEIVTAALGAQREKNPLEDRLATLEGRIQAEERGRVERAQGEIVSTVGRFSEEMNDKGEKLYPHMDDPAVSELMTVLIRSGAVNIAQAGGVVPALKIAYDQAVHANPATRAAIMKSAEQVRTSESETQRREAVAKAQRLGGQVRGSGSSNSTTETVRKGDLRSTLNDAARRSGVVV